MCAAVLLTAATSAAQVTTHLGQASWEADTRDGSVATDDFAGFPDPAQDIPEGVEFDVGLFDVLYTTVVGNGNSAIDVGGLPTPRLRLRTDQTGNDAVTAIEFVFDPPVTAFGADWSSVDAADGITMDVDGTPIDLSAALVGSGEAGFIGFTSRQPVDMIVWSWSGDAFFTTSQVFVPEPAADLLGCVSLASLGVIRRMIRRRPRRP
jgi:hypothetical protein